MYLSFGNGQPNFATLLTKIDFDNNTISYAVSVCHSKYDLFSKEIGRSRALGRFNQKPIVLKHVKLAGASAHDLTRHVMQDILSYKENVSSFDSDGFFRTEERYMPTRLRKYAKTWLNNYTKKLPSAKKWAGMKKELLLQSKQKNQLLDSFSTSEVQPLLNKVS